MSVLPTARADAQTATIVRAAATEMARLLPSAVTLEVAEHQTVSGPGPQTVAVRASFVGTTSAELIVVADQAVAEALSGTDAAISVADALRPALEAAAATLGPGVLDEAQEGPLGSALEESDVVTVALVGPDRTPQAWFAMRVRQRPEAVPQQRVAPTERSPLRLLHDVEMTLTAEIGRTRLPVRQVLELVPGTVLELDRAAGSPADVMVNGRLVARGEVVVVDEDYGIRITEIVANEGV